MEMEIEAGKNSEERLPYSKPHLMLFGEVFSLTAAGSQQGDENNMGNNILMIMV